MRNTKPRRLASLGQAEQAVLDHLWSHGPLSSEACRHGLESTWPMKDSTIRTVLRRLEAKGYVTHTIEGRAFVYRASEPQVRVGTRVVTQVIDRLFGGSAERLVLGLVDHEVLSEKQLERLARKIAERRRQKP